MSAAPEAPRAFHGHPHRIGPGVTQVTVPLIVHGNDRPSSGKEVARR